MLNAVAAPGRPAGPERHAIQHRLQRVGEPRRLLRHDDVVDEAAAGRERVGADERTGSRVVDVRVARVAAGHEEPPSIDLHADRGPARLGLDEECALARAKAAAVDGSRRDRADVELLAARRDAFRLEAVRQVDPVRKGALRAGERRHHQRPRLPARAGVESFEVPLRPSNRLSSTTGLPCSAVCDAICGRRFDSSLGPLHSPPERRLRDLVRSGRLFGPSPTDDEVDGSAATRLASRPVARLKSSDFPRRALSFRHGPKPSQVPG